MPKIRLLRKDITNGCLHQITDFQPEVIEMKELNMRRMKEISELRNLEPDKDKKKDIYVFYHWEDEFFDISQITIIG